MDPPDVRAAAGEPTAESAPCGDVSLDLLEKARAGDRDAADRLVQRLLPPLRRWARHRMPRRARGIEDTDDLVQEAVLAALTRLQALQYRGTGSIHAYVRQVVANRIRDAVHDAERRARTVPTSDALPDGSFRSPLEEAIGSEALDRYERSLARIADDDRAAIVARIELGLPYVEIAAMTGRSSPDAARMAVARALTRLAREMRRDVR